MSRLRPTPSNLSISSDQVSHMSRDESYFNKKGQKVREITMSIVGGRKKKNRKKKPAARSKGILSPRPNPNQIKTKMKNDSSFERSPTLPQANMNMEKSNENKINPSENIQKFNNFQKDSLK